MKNFVKGLGLGFFGLLILVVFTPLSCAAEVAEGGIPAGLLILLLFGLLFFLGGPVFFWLILPLYNRLTRRSPGRT